MKYGLRQLFSVFSLTISAIEDEKKKFSCLLFVFGWKASEKFYELFMVRLK